MRNRLLRAAFALAFLLPLLPVFAADGAKPSPATPPATRRDAVTETLHGVGVSHDANTLFYGIGGGGADEVEVHAFEVEKRADLPDTLPTARYGGFSFTPDGRTVYYSVRTPGNLPRVRVHAMGTDSKTDKE